MRSNLNPTGRGLEMEAIVMAKHTEGPWKIEDGELIATGPDGNGAAVLGQIYGADEYPCADEDIDEECKANGRLIAAAPELLMACKFAAKYHQMQSSKMTGHPFPGQLIDALTAAIAKAEKGGGEP